jgi:hypothetical protein
LTTAEFEKLHAADRDAPPPSDLRLDVSGFALDEQARAVDSLWGKLS